MVFPDTHIAGLPVRGLIRSLQMIFCPSSGGTANWCPKVISGGTYLTETHFTFAPS